MKRFTPILLLVLTLTACERTFAPFPFRMETPTGVREFALRDVRPRSAEAEAVLDPAADPIRLMLRDPVALDEPETTLVVGFSRFPDGVTIGVIGTDGEQLAESYPSHQISYDDRTLPVSVALRLPARATITGFTFDIDDEAPSPVRLTGLTTRRIEPGVGIQGTDRTLLASPGIVVERWNDDRNGAWTIDRRNAYGWDDTDPVEIRYHFERELPPHEELLRGITVPHAVVRTGGVDFRLDLRPGSNRVVLYPDSEGLRVERLAIETGKPGLRVEWIGPVRPLDEPLPAAIPADLGTVLRYRPEQWRQPDFELFSWTRYPDVLILDSATYEIQTRFFRRLAFFVEKMGYRGTVLTDEQLGSMHGYNAHNYNGEGLAAFYHEADRTGVTLTEEEELLRAIVLAHGIIREAPSGYEPGVGGILGISQESSIFPTLRELLISHEAYHGIYYVEPEFVTAIDRLWESLDESEQYYWELLLSGMQYDVTFEYLVRNEFQGYLLQQPVSSATWYFETRMAERIARWHPAQAQWLRRYLAAYSGTHRRQAAEAQAALYSITGFIARDVYCLTPLR